LDVHGNYHDGGDDVRMKKRMGNLRQVYLVLYYYIVLLLMDYDDDDDDNLDDNYNYVVDPG
jgi:hypothetical protein